MKEELFEEILENIYHYVDSYHDRIARADALRKDYEKGLYDYPKYKKMQRSAYRDAFLIFANVCKVCNVDEKIIKSYRMTAIAIYQYVRV